MRSKYKVKHTQRTDRRHGELFVVSLATCCQFIYSSPNHLGGAIESNSVLFGREETCLFCLVAGTAGSLTG